MYFTEVILIFKCFNIDAKWIKEKHKFMIKNSSNRVKQAPETHVAHEHFFCGPRSG